MTRREANVILDIYSQLTKDLVRYPRNSAIQIQILIVEQIIIDLGLGQKDLHKKILTNIQLMHDYIH